jgi:hypothetical protein
MAEKYKIFEYKRSGHVQQRCVIKTPNLLESSDMYQIQTSRISHAPNYPYEVRRSKFSD